MFTSPSAQPKLGIERQRVHPLPETQPPLSACSQAVPGTGKITATLQKVQAKYKAISRLRRTGYLGSFQSWSRQAQQSVGYARMKQLFINLESKTAKRREGQRERESLGERLRESERARARNRDGERERERKRERE